MLLQISAQFNPYHIRFAWYWVQWATLPIALELFGGIFVGNYKSALPADILTGLFN